MGKLAPNILKTATPGKYSDGEGLYLTVTGRDDRGEASGYWVYRYSFAKTGRKDMGLGSVRDLSLKQAREARDRWREVLRQGRDPKAVREEQARLAQAERDAATFAQVANAAFEAHKAGLKGEKNAARWFGPVRLHLLPKLGAQKIEQIHQEDIAQALHGLWSESYPTAKKALDRLAVIYRHAAAMGLDVNLTVPEHARLLLGKPQHRPKSHPALPLDQIRRLYASLDLERTPDRALALYLLIGGGTRLKPLREAHISQFSGDIWNVPGEAMKGRYGEAAAVFRVPLGAEALAIVEAAKNSAVGGCLFPSRSRKVGAVVSDQTIENLFRDREERWGWREPYRPHGIRAAFRTWAGEDDPLNFTVAETAIGHRVETSLERTYQRTDFLEQRRTLLARWASQILGGAQ